MMSRKFVVAIVAMCLGALVAQPATAEVVTGAYAAYVKTYQLPVHDFIANPVDPVVSGISFDPSYQDPVTNDYDRLFFLNRGSSDATRKLYWTSPSTESVSSGLAVTGASGTSADPTDVVADSNGAVYINFLSTPSVQKITNPTTSPVQSQLLGNYGSPTVDDDPISIDLMPANFGLTGYGAGDLLLLDNGLDADPKDALSAVKGDGSGINQLLWSKTEPTGTANDHYYRGAANPVEGKYYFADAKGMTTVDIGGTVYPAILRIGGDMTLETIAIDLPVGETFTKLDDAVAVNPIDGSVWLVRHDEVWGTRSVVRVDTAAAVSEGGNVYLAPASVEITWANEAFDCGINSACFSPDGKYLAIGSLVGANTAGNRAYDKMSIFTVVPEPSAWALIGLGLLSVAMIRRRF